jgi:O-antigen/teichoic acid export membrane protein
VTNRPADGVRAAKNAALLSTIRFVAPVLSVLLMLVLSRVVGTEGLGRYALAYGFLAFLNTVAPLGLNAIITREGSRTPEKLQALIGNATTIGFFGSLGLLIGNWAIVSALGYDPDTERAVLLLSAAIVPTTLSSLFEAGLLSRERVGAIGYSIAVEYVVKVGGGVIVLLAGQGLDSVLLLAVVGKWVGCAVSGSLLWRLGVSVKFLFERKSLRWLLALSPTFLLTCVFATLYWRIDVFMLSKLGTLHELGLYGASWRVLEYTMVVSSSICLAMYPQLAAHGRGNAAHAKRMGRAVARYLFAFSMPIAVISTTSGDWILGLVFGSEFRDAGTMLSILMWTLVPYGVIRFNAYILIANDRQRIDLVINGCMCAVNILLNLWLIPRLGGVGAAVATLVSVVTYGALQSGYMRYQMPEYLPGLTIPLSVLAGSAIVAVWTSSLSTIAPVLALVTSPFLYVACLVGGQFFTRQEAELLRLDRYLPNFIWRRGAS